MSTRAESYLGQIKKEFPRTRLVPRGQSRLMRLLFGPLSLVTKKTYSDFATTIGSTIYVPDDFDTWSDDRQYVLLRHETTHIRQFHEFPLGRQWWVLNHVLFAICYLLVLPVRWTMRARFEREAYYQGLLAGIEMGWYTTPASRQQLADWLAETFGGPSYLWMGDRDKTRAWVLAAFEAIDKGSVGVFPPAA